MNNDMSNIEEQFETIKDTLSLFKIQINALQKHINTVEKNIKKNAKLKPPTYKAKRNPTGFAKPVKITKELCNFIDIPEGTEMARTEVTKALVKYIKQNNLLNKNEITTPDTKLIKLLDISEEEYSKLTYFNIQKYMNKHFIKEPNIHLASEEKI